MAALIGFIAYLALIIFLTIGLQRKSKFWARFRPSTPHNNDNERGTQCSG